jgi:hypothetical protein
MRLGLVLRGFTDSSALLLGGLLRAGLLFARLAGARRINLADHKAA